MGDEENPNAFKHWFNAAALDWTEATLAAVHPGFDRAAFRAGTRGLEALELKDRVRCITISLEPALSLPFPEAARVLVRALPEPIDPDVPNQHHFRLWPWVHYVGRFGLDYPDDALDAFHAITQRFSAEFDIRPYLVRHPERVLARLEAWTRDPSKNVRRLVSEGTRPRLPWGERLHAFVRDPAPVFPLLSALRLDPSEYVRRSVANHIGDIAKDHPERAVGLIGGWLQAARDPHEADTLRALARHALRHRVKAGDQAALELLGYGSGENLRGALSVSPGVVPIGGAVELAGTVENVGIGAVSAVIDYVVHYPGASGALRRKVFKLANVSLEPNVPYPLKKRHSMRPVSIRALFAGAHVVELQANGAILARAEFQLT